VKIRKPTLIISIRFAGRRKSSRKRVLLRVWRVKMPILKALIRRKCGH